MGGYLTGENHTAARPRCGPPLDRQRRDLDQVAGGRQGRGLVLQAGRRRELDWQQRHLRLGQAPFRRLLPHLDATSGCTGTWRGNETLATYTADANRRVKYPDVIYDTGGRILATWQMIPSIPRGTEGILSSRFHQRRRLVQHGDRRPGRQRDQRDPNMGQLALDTANNHVWMAYAQGEAATSGETVGHRRLGRGRHALQRRRQHDRYRDTPGIGYVRHRLAVGDMAPLSQTTFQPPRPGSTTSTPPACPA